MHHITDRYKRIIDYMRISITDKCNLRCIYCMPKDGIKLFEHSEVLTYEEIVRIVRVAAGLGVKKIRITGGEPLIKRDLPFLISSIKAIEGIEDISLTTNGLLLKQKALQLKEAGLNRINISLDSFRSDRYREITRGGNIADVLDGIREAEMQGLRPIKINMVPIRGINDDEIEDFARATMTSENHIRFIEFMPFGSKDLWSVDRYIGTDEIKQRVSTIAPLEAVKARKSGPARYYKFREARGVIGFISPITHHFCSNCNRLRLTSNGLLRPCLFSDTEIDLKSALRSNSDDSELERLLRLSIEVKPQGHEMEHQRSMTLLKPMSKIGG